MFINTKKTIKIASDNGTVFLARAGWIGEIPKWVEEHWYFKALCKDGSVTSIVSSKDKDIDAALGQQKPVEPPKTAAQTKGTKAYVPPKVVETPKADGGDTTGDGKPAFTIEPK